MELIELIDILGIAAFSISGAFAAMEKKLDIFGIFVMAFITALGGGTLRDLLIGEQPVSWMLNMNYSLIVFLSFLAAVLFSNLIRNFHPLLLLFDSLGLGLFTIIGIQKGIQADLHPVMCVALGTITACFGGIIRDVVLNNIPLIFQKEIYASACIAGGDHLLFVAEKSGTQRSAARRYCHPLDRGHPATGGEVPLETAGHFHCRPNMNSFSRG